MLGIGATPPCFSVLQLGLTGRFCLAMKPLRRMLRRPVDRFDDRVVSNLPTMNTTCFSNLAERATDGLLEGAQALRAVDHHARLSRDVARVFLNPERCRGRRRVGKHVLPLSQTFNE